MPSSPQLLAREYRTNFRADAFANVAWVMLLISVQSFALVLARRLGAGTVLLAASAAMGYVPGVITGVLAPLCRRFPLGTVMIALRVLAGAGVFVCLLWPTLVGLAIGFCLLTILGGLVEASYPVLVTLIYLPQRQSQAMSLIYTARALAAFLWLVVLGRVLSHGDPAHCIRVLGMVGLLGFVAGGAHWRFRRKREALAPSSPAETEAGTPPWANREFIYYMISLTIFGCGWLFALFITPILQVNVFKLSNGQVGILAAANMLMQMAAFFYFSRYCEVRACNRLLAIPYVLLGIPIAVYTVLVLFHQYPPFHPVSFWVLLIANGLGGIGVGLQAMYFYLVVNALAGSSSRLRYQTFQQTINGVRGVITPCVAGLVYFKCGLLPCVLTATLLIMLSGVLASVLSTTNPPPARQVKREGQPAEMARTIGTRG